MDSELRRKTLARLRVGPDDQCWTWIGSIEKQGYGRLHVTGVTYMAHRLAYEAFVGPIPDGLQIDHLCRNRGCVNPRHMEPVTSAENTRRGFSKSALNAVKTHCKQGHEFTPENTAQRSNGHRGCRICLASASRRWREKVSAREAALGSTI